MKTSLLITLLLFFFSLSDIIHCQTFVHPGILHTQEDIDRMVQKVNAGESPWIEGWNKLTSNSHAQASYSPNPQEEVCCGGNGCADLGGESFMPLANDCAAAYQCALRYRISGETAYAEKAIQIMNAWSSTFIRFTGDSNMKLRAGLYGYQFAAAAELMREYSGWSTSDFNRFKTMLLDKFYTPHTRDFLDRHNNTCFDHYWANWDLANMASCLAIAILCDDQAKFDHAVEYFKSGSGTGQIDRLCNYLYDGDPVLGQCQESGRDQGHATLCISLVGAYCQIAYNQGEDLFAYKDNKVLALCEYTAKYNLGQSVPFTEYTNCENNRMTEISSDARGTVRPAWELIYNHYVNIKGLNAPFSQQWASDVRPEGGGGDYGSTSGGFDQLGFGTLTYTVASSACSPTAITPYLSVDNGSWQQTANVSIDAGASVKFGPQPSSGGTWSWSGCGTSGSSREQTVSPTNSCSAVATYTNGCGTSSTQTFNISVGGSCDPTSITPYLSVDNGSWQQTNNVTIDEGSTVKFGPQPSSGGSWSWDGCGTSGSAREQSVSPSSSCGAVATYTNDCGAESSETFNITVNGSCDPTAIIPVLQVNGGNWQETSSVTVDAGATIVFGPKPETGGTWSWSGCGTTGSSREQTITATSSCVAQATFTNDCGAQTTQNFDISVNNNIEVGQTYVLSVKHSGQCLDVASGSTSAGANLLQWPYLGGENQQWELIDAGNGYYSLKSVLSGLYLDVANNSTADGANISQWNPNSGQNQQFNLNNEGEGYYSIVMLHSGKCVEVENGSSSNGANVQQSGCDDDDNQLWIFELASLKSAGEGLTKENIPFINEMVFPNPVDDELYINALAGSEIKVFDLMGKMVMSDHIRESNQVFNINYLKTGVYYIQITDKISRSIIKMIKN